MRLRHLLTPRGWLALAVAAASLILIIWSRLA